MPAPEQFVVPRFAAEPPHDPLPSGEWATELRGHFLAACLAIEADLELGEPEEPTWYPDRSWHGRTFVPATARTSAGLEVYGYVSFAHGRDGDEPSDFHSVADFTEETAEANPQWRIDLCDEVIGSWRGEGDETAAMTLVWGRPLVAGAVIATALLGTTTVDQCRLLDDRFTLIAPDAYGDETLGVELYDDGGVQLAFESLYDDEETDEH